MQSDQGLCWVLFGKPQIQYYWLFFVPPLSGEDQGDMVFCFPWFVVHVSALSDSMYLVSVTPHTGLANIFENVQVFLSWSEACA